jgi:hypothetical protein
MRRQKNRLAKICEFASDPLEREGRNILEHSPHSKLPIPANRAVGEKEPFCAVDSSRTILENEGWTASKL